MESMMLEYLAAGGGVGIWVLAVGMWRLEKRVTILEVKTE